jgi:hypothetical protein
MKHFFTLLILFCTMNIFAQTPLQFSSKDGITIYANLYETKNKPKQIMLLCHQARYSKGEYKETAPLFVKMGYTCMAIDQRSGDSINNEKNKTAQEANAKILPTEYIDAEQDIEAALNYLYKKYHQKIILVGSSYSSSLILKIANNNLEKVKATISYSPGEYFDDTTLVATNLLKLKTIPIYITCSNAEIAETQILFDLKINKNIIFFKPKAEGKHGSKALWANNTDNHEYWTSLKLFLKTLK